jgi:hypothetical protein
MQPHGKQTFYCPTCREKLSFLDGTIIKLLGRLHATTFTCETMFYFAAKLGTHGCIVGEGVKVFAGAKVEFCCPSACCGKDFTAPYYDGLAEILMEDERGVAFRVVFSKIFGKDSTFLLDTQRQEVVQSYGADVDHVFKDSGDRSRNFFGE